MKTDIKNEEDVKLLVDEFYAKVIADETLDYIFNNVAAVNWQKHLPIMYGFWSANLLGTTTYKGYLIDAHFKLNAKVSLHQTHFDIWISLFNQTVDQFFEGEKAELAKARAKTIADLMFYKITTQESIKKQK